MSEVAVIQDNNAALITMIERAAINPDVDIEKMERLLQMHERIQMRQAETDFNASMTGAQSVMGRISADATNPQTRSNYASYGKLDSVLRPIYTEHGFALSFDTGEVEGEVVRVICRVSHRGGFSREYHVDMPADGKGAKGGDVMTKTHATGAAMTYGMRYLLKMIFNVAIGEEDTDGNKQKSNSVRAAVMEDIRLNDEELALVDDWVNELRAVMPDRDGIDHPKLAALCADARKLHNDLKIAIADKLESWQRSAMKKITAELNEKARQAAVEAIQS